GDVRIAAAIARGEIGKPGELPVLENAVGQPQPTHVGALRRRDVEETVKAPAEIIGRLRRFVLRGLRLQLLVAIEGMKLALELLLVGKLLAFLHGAGLRLDCRSVLTDRLPFCLRGRRRRSTRDVARLSRAPRLTSDQHAGRKALEITSLLGGELTTRSR